MVGHDTKATTMDAMQLQGNAMLNAYVKTGQILADTSNDAVAVIDVNFTNITDQTGMAARVESMSWSDLQLMDRSADGMTAAGFVKADGEIEGWLFDDGNEVVGKFNHMDIVGAYGATLDAGMDMSDN